MKNFFKFNEPTNSYEFYIKNPELQIAQKYNKDEKFFSELNKNIEIIKSFFHFPKSNDFKIRTFEIDINSNKLNAVIMFYDGLVDSDTINSSILKPLMKSINIESKSILKNNDISEKIKNEILR